MIINIIDMPKGKKGPGGKRDKGEAVDLNKLQSKPQPKQSPDELIQNMGFKTTEP